LLGDISVETGFVQGKVIFGGRTVDGVGGGVCQVSTTAFRAAFTAGFPIIERNSHGYRVGFYELNSGPGLDAAIFQPEADFRFLNDTDYHLLIETSVYPANSSIQFRFYSTNPGRQVTIEGPVVRNVTAPLPTIFEANADLQGGVSQQVDWAAEGADVTLTRIIRDAGGNEIERDELFTHYEPWAAVVQVAPGDPRLTT
jgi:vancomycin resistance protein YoaR